MPTASEPRIVVRIGSEDRDRIQQAADIAGVGISTLLRECAVRGDHYLDVARELAGQPPREPSAAQPTMPPPPADPVPSAAFKFKCPNLLCPRTFGSPLAVCPEHGRRAVAF